MISQLGLRGLVAHYYSGPIPPERQLLPLYGALLLYVFRGCKQQSIRALISHYDYQFDFLSWRRNLHRMGYLLKDQKLWTFWYFAKEESLQEIDLSVKEKNCVRLALNFKPLQRHLDHLHSGYGAVPLRPGKLDSLIQASLYSDDVTAYLRSQVKTKMGFLVKSFGYTHSDLLCELRISALNALLKSYPRYEDVGHMKAICKSAAHNHSINFIQSNTTEGRQRLRQNPDGSYGSLLVSMDLFGADQVVSSEGGGSASATLVAGIDGVSQSQWEQMFSLRELQNHPKMNARHREFFRLALGKPDQLFSDFLGGPNEELIERKPYPDYLKSVRKYLGLSESTVNSFLSSLKPHL